MNQTVVDTRAPWAFGVGTDVSLANGMLGTILGSSGRASWVVGFADGDMRSVPFDRVCRIRGCCAAAKPAPATDEGVEETVCRTCDDDDDDCDDDDCPGCMEEYGTGRRRRRVTCPGCRKDACQSCVRTYLTMDDTRAAQCMQCSREWSRSFLIAELGTSFVTGAYRQHRKRLLLGTEMALMPSTMPALETYLALKRGRERKRELEARINDCWENDRWRRTDELQDLRGELYEVQRLLYQLGQAMERIMRPNREPGGQRRVFRHACPIEGCRGFLSPSWRCPVCEHWICRECMCPRGKTRDAEHTCDPNMRASAALIRKETRNCPSCAAPISKIDGCDQMWCVQCHAAFSWQTGRRVHGRVHNPHYFEWHRRMTENGGDGAPARRPARRMGGPCDGNQAPVPVPDEIELCVRSARHNLSGARDDVTRTMSSMIEESFRRDFADYSDFRFNFMDGTVAREAAEVAPEQRNLDLRLRYLANETDRKSMAVTLLKRDNRRCRQLEEHRVFELINTIIGERLLSVVQRPNNSYLELFKFHRYLRSAIKYANDEMRRISACYNNCAVRMFLPGRIRIHAKRRRPTDDEQP